MTTQENFDNFAKLIKIVEYLVINSTQDVDESNICGVVIEKCPQFSAVGSPRQLSLLDLAVSLYKPTVSNSCFSLLLESGGHVFINKFERDGFQPLKLKN